MSLLEAPRGARRPILTYVMEYDRELAREAIARERRRQCQNIHIGLHLFYLLFVIYTESLFLIYYEKSQILELRRPIQTYVMEYDRELAREAIARELARHGQVYYVYNRVEGIERFG